MSDTQESGRDTTMLDSSDLIAKLNFAESRSEVDEIVSRVVVTKPQFYSAVVSATDRYLSRYTALYDADHQADPPVPMSLCRRRWAEVVFGDVQQAYRQYFHDLVRINEIGGYALDGTSAAAKEYRSIFDTIANIANSYAEGVVDVGKLLIPSHISVRGEAQLTMVAAVGTDSAPAVRQWRYNKYPVKVKALSSGWVPSVGGGDALTSPFIHFGMDRSSADFYSHEFWGSPGNATVAQIASASITMEEVTYPETHSYSAVPIQEMIGSSREAMRNALNAGITAWRNGIKPFDEDAELRYLPLVVVNASLQVKAFLEFLRDKVELVPIIDISKLPS